MQKRTVVMWLVVLICAVAAPSWATVTCANGDTAAVSVTDFNPSGEISLAAGNLPPGCNPATKIKLSGTNLWRWPVSVAVAAGGDKVSWTGSWVNGFGYGRVVLDADDGLSALVTPVSPLATGTLDVLVTGLTSTTATFSVTWSGTDIGVAQRLRWYEYPLPPGPDPTYGGHIGDNTALPLWSSLSVLLHEELRVGPWSETIVVPITASDSSNIILALGGIAVSTPEPSSGLLLGAGLAAAALLSRLRRRGGG